MVVVIVTTVETPRIKENKESRQITLLSQLENVGIAGDDRDSQARQDSTAVQSLVVHGICIALLQ